MYVFWGNTNLWSIFGRRHVNRNLLKMKFCFHRMKGEESFMITFKVKPLFCRKYAFSSVQKGQFPVSTLSFNQCRHRYRSSSYIHNYIIFIEFFKQSWSKYFKEFYVCMYIEKSERQIITIDALWHKHNLFSTQTLVAK